MPWKQNDSQTGGDSKPTPCSDAPRKDFLDTHSVIIWCNRRVLEPGREVFPYNVFVVRLQTLIEIALEARGFVETVLIPFRWLKKNRKELPHSNCCGIPQLSRTWNIRLSTACFRHTLQCRGTVFFTSWCGCRTDRKHCLQNVKFSQVVQSNL